MNWGQRWLRLPPTALQRDFLTLAELPVRIKNRKKKRKLGFFQEALLTIVRLKNILISTIVQKQSMNKYIAYCRKSTDEKDKQVLSIEAQIAELKEFAKRDHLESLIFITEAKTAKMPGVVSNLH